MSAIFQSIFIPIFSFRFRKFVRDQVKKRSCHAKDRETDCFLTVTWVLFGKDSQVLVRPKAGNAGFRMVVLVWQVPYTSLRDLARNRVARQAGPAARPTVTLPPKCECALGGHVGGPPPERISD